MAVSQESLDHFLSVEPLMAGSFGELSVAESEVMGAVNMLIAGRQGRDLWPEVGGLRRLLGVGTRELLESLESLEVRGLVVSRPVGGSEDSPFATTRRVARCVSLPEFVD